MKKCVECGYESPPHGDKYCKLCRGKILNQMRRDGYFTPIPKRPRERPPDAQEDRKETKFGIDD